MEKFNEKERSSIMRSMTTIQNILKRKRSDSVIIIGENEALIKSEDNLTAITDGNSQVDLSSFGLVLKKDNERVEGQKKKRADPTKSTIINKIYKDFSAASTSVCLMYFDSFSIYKLT